jgi:hypothetical protein
MGVCSPQANKLDGGNAPLEAGKERERRNTSCKIGIIKWGRVLEDLRDSAVSVSGCIFAF